MSQQGEAAIGKTMLKRIEQYRDRWTSDGTTTGLVSLSDKLSPAQLKTYEIFADYDDKFLERISPDVSVAVWKKGAVLFEEGSYLDLAFFVADGEVEIFLQAQSNQETGASPIFDLSRTGIIRPEEAKSILAAASPKEVSGTVEKTFLGTSSKISKASQEGAGGDHEITFLATMDFDLPQGAATRLGPGELFGEIGALSGWPQSVTARVSSDCRLVQIRVPALRLMRRKSAALKARLDSIYRSRSLFSQLKTSPLFRGTTDLFLDGLKEIVELVSCEPGEVIVRQGEPADCLYLLRSGFVRLIQTVGEGEAGVSYLSKGMSLGEVELLVDGVDSWESTAVSVEFVELVKIPAEAMQSLLDNFPEVAERLWRSCATRIREVGFSKRHVAHAEFTQVALDMGLVQGSSILAIDLNSCTRCDDCVKACADTHEGRSRFVREGDKYDNLLIPRSCYHCRDPVCLVGCPTGAIHRAGVDDVVEIEDKICIGCSTCANNCPYDAIVMHDTATVWPEDMVPTGLRGRERRVASKCDLCHDTGHGPACVSNCPQGCAFRVGSLEEFQQLLARET
ncbi:MAG: cyclic nucleotide-binding domain-containing protein [Deltaproteobacteria bacterium]|nr:cyclic nucleotide-binding domain-containing protein [Deltaproteobacteria bacterium]